MIIITKKREVKDKYWVDKKGKEWLLYQAGKEQQKRVDDEKKKHDCECSKVKGGIPDCCPCGGLIHGQIVGHCNVCGGGACLVSKDNLSEKCIIIIN